MFDNIADKLDENGYDRYESAVSMLENAGDDFEVSDCFNILERTSQSVCPTVVQWFLTCKSKQFTGVKTGNEIFKKRLSHNG